MTTYLCLDGWAGRQRIPCEVLSETPKYYRVQLQVDAQLPHRWRVAGDVVLVPKYAIQQEEDKTSE